MTMVLKWVGGRGELLDGLVGGVGVGGGGMLTPLGWGLTAPPTPIQNYFSGRPNLFFLRSPLLVSISNTPESSCLDGLATKSAQYFNFAARSLVLR